jgi:hypothetical protein
MARFALTDIDWDQRGFGAGHAIPELSAQLPVTTEVTRRIPAADRDDYYLGVLERRVKYHPAGGFDWSRTQPEFTATDSDGQFLWIYAIVVASLTGEPLRAGMRGLAVHLAYVIDPTVGRDARLDFGKCDPIGWGTITESDPPTAGQPRRRKCLPSPGARGCTRGIVRSSAAMVASASRSAKPTSRPRHSCLTRICSETQTAASRRPACDVAIVTALRLLPGRQAGKVRKLLTGG